jgi:PhnB protein
MPVSYVPAGHNTVSPYLTVRDARGLATFIEKTFDAKTIHFKEMPGGAVHAELRVQDSIVMLGQTMPGGEIFPGQIHVYVPSVDETYARALRAGGTSIRQPTDMPYGDRISMVRDPFDNVWAISTHKEDV